MKKKLVLLLALVLCVYPLAAGCTSTPDEGQATVLPETVEASSDSTQPSSDGLTAWTQTPPADARVPTVKPPLETHPGDAENFYADTDDYIVWAKTSANTKADREYRIVSFGSDGFETVGFMKYVFSNQADAEDFAATHELLLLDGNVVYYKGWFGPEVPEKTSVIELVKVEAEPDEYYISKPPQS